jgi:hypothetical protein
MCIPPPRKVSKIPKKKSPAKAEFPYLIQSNCVGFYDSIAVGLHCIAFFGSGGFQRAAHTYQQVHYSTFFSPKVLNLPSRRKSHSKILLL